MDGAVGEVGITSHGTRRFLNFDPPACAVTLTVTVVVLVSEAVAVTVVELVVAGNVTLCHVLSEADDATGEQSLLSSTYVVVPPSTVVTVVAVEVAVNVGVGAVDVCGV